MGILMAAMHPERVEALVLYGAYAKRQRSGDYPWAPTAEERRQYMERLAVEWSWEADMRVMCPSADDAMAQWWGQRARAAATPSTVRSLIAMNTVVDVRDALRSVHVPTLVLHRRGDRDSRIDEGRYLAKHIPGAEIRRTGRRGSLCRHRREPDPGSGAGVPRRPAGSAASPPRVLGAVLAVAGPAAALALLSAGRAAHTPDGQAAHRLRRPSRRDPRRAGRPRWTARQGHPAGPPDRRGATDRAGGRWPGSGGRRWTRQTCGTRPATCVTGRTGPRCRAGLSFTPVGDDAYRPGLPKPTSS